MQFLDDKQSDRGELDLTPLINIIFLILIFFMLTAAIAPADDAAIKPVLSSVGEAPPETATYSITVDRTAAIYFEGRLLDKNALTSRLFNLGQSGDRLTLSIKADAELDANSLLEVLSIATDAGIDSVALMTIRR